MHVGDLLHPHVKKLRRFVRPRHRVTSNQYLDSPRPGWEYVHAAIDDHSRVSFASNQPNEIAHSACAAC